MVAKTWYMTNNLAGAAHQEMSETDPGTEANASPQTGWVVGTGSTNHSSLDAQSNRASSTFTATTDPDGTPATGAGAGDCLRSTNTYTGDFASGNWTFSFCFRGVTQAGTQDGRIRFRLLKGKDPTGSDAVDISGSQQQASLVTNLLTTPTQTSSLVVNPGAFTVGNDYIFVQLAWERTGAGGMTTTDVAFRIGNASGAGTRVQSADFTPTPPRTDPPDKTGLLTQPGAHLRRFGGAAMSAALLAVSGIVQPIAPPPPPVVAPEPFWMPSVTTMVPLRRTLFYQAKIAPPVVPPLPAEAETFSITTGVVRGRPLFYQANIQPPHFRAEVVVDVTPAQWLVPLSRAAPRPAVKATLVTPFVPQLAPPVTADEWLQPFQRQVGGPFPVRTQPVLAYVAAPAVTPDQWQQPFQKAVPLPPAHHTQPVSGYKPEEVVTLTTTLEWLQPFNKAVSTPSAHHTQPVSGYKPEEAVVSNLTTTLEWMQAWALPRPRGEPIHTQPVLGDVHRPGPVVAVPVEGFPAVFRRTLQYQTTAWSPRPAERQGIEWLQPLGRAAPRTLQRLAAGVSYSPPPPPNYRSEWDWPVAWNLAAKTRRPVHTQPVSGRFVAPPTLGWLRGFDRPAAKAAARPTQPNFVYRPEAAVVTLTTTLEWLQSWQAPVEARPVRHTQPFYGYPYEQAPAPVVAVPVQGFQQVFRRTLQYQATAWCPQPIAPAVVEVGSGFHSPLSGAPGKRWPPLSAYEHRQFGVVLPNTVTIDKWRLEWHQPAKAPKPIHTQPFFGYPYVGVTPPEPPAFVSTAINWAYPSRKTLYYQAWTFGYPYEQAGVTYSQEVTAGLTVAFHRMLRYSCKAETDEGFVEQDEQSDPWTTQAEVTVNFADEIEQSDPWSTQDEVADSSDEEDPNPQSGCE